MIIPIKYGADGRPSQVGEKILDGPICLYYTRFSNQYTIQCGKKWVIITSPNQPSSHELLNILFYIFGFDCIFNELIDSAKKSGYTDGYNAAWKKYVGTMSAFDHQARNY